MSFKFALGKIAAGALLSVALAASHAAQIVTFNPTGNNGGAGKLANSGSQFDATGINGGLLSTLVISKNTNLPPTVANPFGLVSFVETGTITLDTFTNNSLAMLSSVTGLTTNYTLSAAFILSGVGLWKNPASPFPGPLGEFAMSPGDAIMSMTLLGKNLVTNQIFTLGTGVLQSAQSGFADTYNQAFTSGSSPTLVAPVANSSTAKKALTGFTGILDFTPNGGVTGPYTGANGFFKAPVPFSVTFDAGSVGGSTSNTSWTSSGGVVTIVTGGAGRTAGSANISFRTNDVPEPATLALIGVALLGLGVSTRRRAASAV